MCYETRASPHLLKAFTLRFETQPGGLYGKRHGCQHVRDDIRAHIQCRHPPDRVIIHVSGGCESSKGRIDNVLGCHALWGTWKPWARGDLTATRRSSFLESQNKLNLLIPSLSLVQLSSIALCPSGDSAQTRTQQHSGHRADGTDIDQFEPEIV